MIRQPFKNTLMYWGWGMKKILRGVCLRSAERHAVYAADVYQPPVEAPFVEQPVEVGRSQRLVFAWDVGYAWKRLARGPLFPGLEQQPGRFRPRPMWMTPTSLARCRIPDQTAICVPTSRSTISASPTSRVYQRGLRGCVNCVSNDVASMSAWSLLANAYVDLATYGAFTPYVGAGIGGTRVKWGTLRKHELRRYGSRQLRPDDRAQGRKRLALHLCADGRYRRGSHLQSQGRCRLTASAIFNGGNMLATISTSGPAYDKDIYVHEAPRRACAIPSATIAKPAYVRRPSRSYISDPG